MTDNVADRPNAGDERGSFDVGDFADELAAASGEGERGREAQRAWQWGFDAHR